MVVVLFDALTTPDDNEIFMGQPTWRSDHAFEFAKQRAMAFLRHANPDARIALYGLDEKLTVLSDFSADRGQLLAALQAYHPVGMGSGMHGRR